MLQNQYTYKYLAQTPTSGYSDSYGSDNYGTSAYSCASTDQVCLAGGPSAPNTGFYASTNPVLLGSLFITIAIVIAVVVYAILSKTKRSKGAK